jgi:pimeloyl-ACP methyl ester carboxylesterase
LVADRTDPAPNAVRASNSTPANNPPAVVLLHGQPGSARDWGAVVPLLDDAFIVLTPDRPGYGRTGGPAAGFAGNATAVVDLLDRQGVDRAVVVGHSWAGGVAIALAGLHPERVQGLVLVASVAPGETFGWDDRLLAAPVVGEGVAAITIGATGLLLGRDRVQTLLQEHLPGRAMEAVNVITSLTGARTGAAAWRSFVTEQRALLAELEDLLPLLGDIHAPTVVLNGATDHIVPPVVADQLSQAIPGAIHTVLPATGHLLPFDHPGAVAAAVRQVAGLLPA